MSNYEALETLKEGSTFRNWDEAINAVYNYAKLLGFNLCQSRKTEHDGELRKRTFICEFSGKPQKNKTGRPSKSKKKSCPWHINLSLPTQNNHENLVKVTKFVDQHNHLTTQMKQDVEMLTHCEGGAAIQRKYLHAKYPEYPLSNQDLSNAIMQYKTTKEDHNTIKMFKYLLTKQKENLGWKVYFDFEPGTTILNKLFWMTPSQVKNWKRYNDVILNDNTHKTSCYDMMLSIFFAIDQNRCIQIVAQALIDNEISESYEWILKRILEATKDEPITIITDMKRDMDIAVECVLPKACHRHSNWSLYLYLENNVKIKLGPKYQEFLIDFFTCRNSLHKESFQKNWDFLIRNYPEIVDCLTNTLYESKKYWAKALMDEGFTADIDSIYENIYNFVTNALNNSNVRVEELIDYINELLEKEFHEINDRERIERSIYRTNDDINKIDHYLPFDYINNLIESYLSPACANLQRREMELSLEFTAKKYDIGLIEKKSMEEIEIEEIKLNCPLESCGIDKQISLKKIFSLWIDTKKINEAWSVDYKGGNYYDVTNYILLMNDGSHHYKANFCITKISKRWYGTFIPLSKCQPIWLCEIS
ncbi:7407_t:CDS:2, partial [Funneliformis geosporum]